MKHLHPKAKWLFFVNGLGVFFFVYTLFVSWFVVALISVLVQNESSIILISLANLIVWILLSYAWAIWTYNNWKYEITEDALRIEKGVIWKRYVSIPYERIQNVDILRGVFDRILGLSDIHVQTAGFSGGSRNGSGYSSEGRLPGLLPQDAEALRDDLIKRAKGTKAGV